MCAETGLRPADIVVAIHDKVPKLVDCYDGTRVPFRVIRDGKEISVEVSTFSIDSFHSKSVVICCGMMIEDAPIQIGVTTRNKAGGTLYIREIQRGSLAGTWEVETPCFLKEFNGEHVQTTTTLVEKLKKAEIIAPEGMSLKT